jgi:hypothetical protein
MTRQKALKRRVRDRMAKTGERYTAARAQLLSDAPPEAAEDLRAERRASDEAVARATGRRWDEWFALLDAWGAAERTHTEIARRLREEHGVASWWSQTVTVEYELARGLRVPGARSDGTFAASASKTVNVAVERLWAAWADPALRERWLPGASVRERTSQPGRTARYDWGDDGSRLVAGFTAKGEAKSTVALEHERLADAEAAEAAKAFWRERLGVLKRMLESEPA